MRQCERANSGILIHPLTFDQWNLNNSLDTMAVSACPALVVLKITSYLTQVSFTEMIKILNKFLHRNHSVNNASKNEQENGRAYISHLNSLSTIYYEVTMAMELDMKVVDQNISKLPNYLNCKFTCPKADEELCPKLMLY